MKYLGTSFSVGYGGSKKYRDNWDAIFGGRPEDTEAETCTSTAPSPAAESPEDETLVEKQGGR